MYKYKWMYIVQYEYLICYIPILYISESGDDTISIIVCMQNFVDTIHHLISPPPDINNITRTLVDASVLQWGQIKTRKLYLSVIPSPSPISLLFTFAPNAGSKSASTLVLL